MVISAVLYDVLGSSSWKPAATECLGAVVWVQCSSQCDREGWSVRIISRSKVVNSIYAKSWHDCCMCNSEWELPFISPIQTQECSWGCSKEIQL